MVVCSLFPSTVTVKIYLNGAQVGSDYTNTLVAFGTDRASAVTLSAELAADIGATTSTAGYVKGFTVTGLAKLNRYTWVATQTQNGIVYTETGSFMTAPSSTDDFELLFGSCDNVKSGVGAGAWSLVRTEISTSTKPISGILWVDDFGYVDANNANDSAGTGHTMSSGFPQTSSKQYDYAIAYMNNLGMFENTANSTVSNGREEDRIYCLQNLNLLPQWGDHEFIQDTGWDSALGSQYTAGKAVWNALLAPLQPASIGSLDTGANHWACQYGCVNIYSNDYITNCSGLNPATETTQQTAILGSNQIKDLLNWRDSNANTFNIWMMGLGIRYTTTDFTGFSTSNDYTYGSQHPIANHCTAEYEQMFTKTGNNPKSIMDSPYSNGQQGVSLTVHGDYHRMTVCKQLAAGDGTHAAELFYTLHNGTFNGYANFSEVNPLAVGDTSGSKVKKIADAGWTSSTHYYGFSKFFVYGSYPVKELHAIMTCSNSGELWHGRWLERSSNEVFPTTWTNVARVINGNKI